MFEPSLGIGLEAPRGHFFVVLVLVLTPVVLVLVMRSVVLVLRSVVLVLEKSLVYITDNIV